MTDHQGPDEATAERAKRLTWEAVWDTIYAHIGAMPDDAHSRDWKATGHDAAADAVWELIRAEVDPLRAENAKLIGKVGYWKQLWERGNGYQDELTAELREVRAELSALRDGRVPGTTDEESEHPEGPLYSRISDHPAFAFLRAPSPVDDTGPGHAPEQGEREEAVCEEQVIDRHGEVWFECDRTGDHPWRMDKGYTWRTPDQRAAAPPVEEVAETKEWQKTPALGATRLSLIQFGSRRMSRTERWDGEEWIPIESYMTTHLPASMLRNVDFYDGPECEHDAPVPPVSASLDPREEVAKRLLAAVAVADGKHPSYELAAVADWLERGPSDRRDAVARALLGGAQ